ncbi:hypothetical protein L226DRAFT_52137 [Lentinus tigrinus ALCF2SS1-7]|uniref:uncharacterized protein n=1 Tax=Lentinus tigrinus ALCF2SS1-7 TaxID=1328758 RepID=UPI001165F492|nr:hypothetical protein L226DRAFT_52137 [Lentinus tigrinus ALCF2SS1-7]
MSQGHAPLHFHRDHGHSAVDVDLCNTGERTLAVCALVCRAWLPKSRAKLFEAIYIRNQRSYDLLVERVVHSETRSIEPLSHLREQSLHLAVRCG